MLFDANRLIKNVMKTIFGIQDKLPPLNFPVVTVGVFDGVHLGHQAIIGRVLEWARREHGESIIITFEPHPEETLFGCPPSFLSSLKHRLVFFERMGVDITMVIRFDKKFASMKAEDFVKEILVGSIGAKGVVLGFDNRFGKGAEGDIDLLKKLGGRFGFEVEGIGALKAEGGLVSSTRLRELIKSGRLDAAEKMLGRSVSVLGTVVRGDGRGRDLGYPTANLDLHHEVRPPAGVYITRALLADKEPGHSSVTFIGRRLTFKDDQAEVVEVHVLDFTGDVYGLDIEVQFLKKIRTYEKFSSLTLLRRAIASDIEQAREFFAHKDG